MVNDLPEIPVTEGPSKNAETTPEIQAHAGLPEIPVVSNKPPTKSLMPHYNGAEVRQHLAGWSSDLWQGWKQLSDHPLGSLIQAAGAPQRLEGAIAENIHNKSSFHDSLNHVNDLVWHPSDEKVQKARSALQSGLGLANDADIDTMINGRNWHALNQLKPYVKNALKTVNNVATDTIGDPFAVISDAATGLRDLGVIKEVPPVTTMIHHAAVAAVHNPATRPLLHAGANTSRLIAGHVYNHLAAHGAGPTFAHIKQAVQGSKNMASNAHQTLEDVFVTRPDLLRAGLTHEGRDVRIQLENAQRVAKHKDFTADEAVVHDADASVARFQEYAQNHGPTGTSSLKDSDFTNENLPVPKSRVKEWEKKITNKMYPKGIRDGLKRGDKEGLQQRADLVNERLTKLRPQLDEAFRKSRSNKLDNIRELDPDERKEFFYYVRDQVHDNELARKSGEVFSQKEGKSLGKKDIDWGKYRAPEDKLIKDIARRTKRMSDVGRAGIELNPLPHGVSNVGTLSALGGGLNAMTHGVAHMVRPIDHAVKGRLDSMGAGTPDYIGGHAQNYFPGYAEAVNSMSGLLGKMEHGWRAGLLDHLDHVLGPSAPGSKEEYLKGALINKKLGDYTNQSAFVKFFGALGGPFVAYHLGILPKAVIDSVKNNPINYLTVGRLRDQNQKNREGADMNELTSGDPVTESAKGAFNPVGYALSSSALPFLWTAGNELANDWQHPSKTGETWDKGLLNIAETHIAPLGMAMGTAENVQGKSFAGQDMTLTDHLAAAIMGALNQHIHHFPSQRTEKADERFTSKHAFEWLPQ
jgi:hypothetical protein